jgi:prepilin-type N-terminal cleavage/methylation domain-containing protein/prepilin-type processing-associated H-X9-DG protein
MTGRLIARETLHAVMSRRHLQSVARSAFTLVELLVVIAIVGMLTALLLPALQGSREAARGASCQNNLRQIGIGLHDFYTAKREFPVGCSGCTPPAANANGELRQISWNVHLLPFIEEQQLWKQLDEHELYNSARNHAAARTVVPVFLCPSTVTQPKRTGPTTGDVNSNGQWDPGDDLAFTDYGGMFGVGDPSLPLGNGVLVYEKSFSAAQITDGLSQTIVVAEDTGRGGVQPDHGGWIDGQNVFDVTRSINKQQDNEVWSDHRNGAYVAFCDGSVRFLSDAIQPKVLFALCTRNQHETIPVRPY